MDDVLEKERHTYLDDMKSEDTSFPEVSNYSKLTNTISELGSVGGEIINKIKSSKALNNITNYTKESFGIKPKNEKTPEMDTHYNSPNRIHSNLGNIWEIGRGIHGLLKPEKTFDRVAPEYVRAANVDPTRALQSATTSYGNARASIRNNSRGVGNYLSNMMGLASSEAGSKAGIHAQYDNINVGFENQARSQNSQIGMSAQQQNAATQKYAEQVNQQERDVASNMIQQGLTDMSTNYMMRKRDKNQYRQDKNTAKFINMLYKNWNMIGSQMQYKKS